MELRHLRYFVVLAEELHFGRAAARLGISQPPLSQQMKALEEELGSRLFERSTRRVALTEAGRMFFAEARAALEQAERAVEVARRAERGELGELAIGMFPSAPLIPAVGRSIRSFRSKFPDVRLRLGEFESRRQIEALCHGQVQIAITRNVTAPLLPSGLAARELLRERFVVILRDDHPLARGNGALATAELRAESFVFYGPHMGLTLPRQVTALCQAAGFEPKISQIADANITIVGLVAVGLGIAVVPEAMARLRHDGVVVRPLSEPFATTSVWLVHPHKDRSPLVRAFLTLILAAHRAEESERAAASRS